MAQYYSLAYIMKTTADVQPTYTYTPGNTGDVMFAKSPAGGFIRDSNFNYDINNSILGITGQIRTDRVIFDNSNVRLGIEAGGNLNDQSANAIAIGTYAGFQNQGADSIAIGHNAGYLNQADNTIILNATGEQLNSVGDASACYIKPIRPVNNDSDPYQSLGYNTTTGEIVSGTNMGFKLTTDNFSVTGGGGEDNLFAYSYDGVHWEQNASGKAARTFADGSCNAIAYDGELWLAGGVGETAIVHSTNGITWERNKDNLRTVLDSGSWRVPVDISGSFIADESPLQTFGKSIGLDTSGNVLVVGAPLYDSSAGIVSIYDYSMNSDTWVKTLDISGGAIDDNYGSALAISSLDSTNTTLRVAVGASNFTSGNGRVYVFDTSFNKDTVGNDETWNGGGRTVGRNLTISNVTTGEKFGSALAKNSAGTRLLVGAPAKLSNRGVVYSYDFSSNSNSWVRNAVDLSNTSGIANGFFGSSIAMNSAGNRCLISEPSNVKGRVYGYDLSGVSGYWGLTTTSTRSNYDQDLSYNPAVCDISFGHAVTMNDAGDWCAVGSPTAGSGRGWVGIYSRSFRLWSLYSDISGQNAGDNFGSAVQINGAGDRLIVGAKGYGSGIGGNFVYNYNPNTLKWDFERVMNSTNGGTQGETLALDTLGNRFVSGTPTNNTNKGAIAVYDRQMKGNALTANGGNWIAGGNAVGVNTTPFAYSDDGITNWQKPATGGATLAAGEAVLRKELFYAPTATNNYFGNACALNAAGTILAVGSYAANTNLGRVCIYDYDMSLNDWLAEPTKVLTGVSAGGSDGYFGMSVALNAAGDRLVVGEPCNNAGGGDAGKIYIYHYNQTTGQWPTTATRTYIGDSASDFFGVAVEINAAGNRIAIGAPFDDDGGTDAGTVFIVDYIETTGLWPGANDTAASSIPGRIKAIGTGASNLGGSLSFNAAGDVLVMGTPAISGVGGAGGIWIIERDNTTGGWGKLGSLTSTTDIPLSNTAYAYLFTKSGATGDTNFGRSISLNAKGDRLAIGEYEYSSFTGRVYIFHYDYENRRWNNGTSADLIMYANPASSTLVRVYEGPATYSLFGWKVALNAAGDRLIVGSVENNVNFTDSGSVHIFDYDYTTGQWPGPNGTYAGKFTHEFLGYSANDFFGASVAINALGNRIACGAARNGNADNFSSGDGSDRYGAENGYLRLYDLTTRPIQLNDCRALTTFNGKVIAGGKGSGKHMFAISSDSGVSWTNQQVDDEVLFNARYDWSGNPLTFPTKQVSKFTEQFFGVGGGTGDEFGYGLAINAKGTRCVISAVNNNSNKGKLYFFHNDDGNGWVLTFTFNNTNPGSAGYLSSLHSIAINDVGDRVIAGAGFNDFNVTDGGSLYIFDYYDDGKGWVESDRIDGSTASYTLGGRSCAMNAKGDRFIVGESREGVATLGFAHIYHYSNGTWSLAKTYTDGTTATASLYKFGFSSAMNGAGDRVVVGCPVDKKVFIYDYNYLNGAWNTTKTIELTAGTGVTTGFGFSCSLNTAGNRLVVGDLTGNGYAYFYERNTTTGIWPSVAQRTYSGQASGDNFGYSVALDGSGDRVIIGALNRDSNGLTNNGAAYLYSYDYTNNVWPYTNTNFDISFNGIATSDQFGASVAFTRLGHKVLIGAVMATNTNYGRAYLYEAARTSASNLDVFCNALAAKGSNELLVAGLGGTGVSNALAWSADGITWNLSDNGATIFAGTSKTCKAVAWNGSRWVAGGRSSGGPLAYSYNGKKWYNSMNSATLLGATSTCNAVAWNGKYWMASVEGATGGQTQVYSNDGMAWIASDIGGDVLFSGTSQALALATIKTGGAGGGSTIQDEVNTLQSEVATLQPEVATLQLTQFGVGQRWSGNLAGSRPRNTSFYNNTNKLMFVTATGNEDTSNHSISLRVGQMINGVEVLGVVATAYTPSNSGRIFISGVVPAGARYYWDWDYGVNVGYVETWYEFYEM
jgi:hypothetical protein